MENLCDLCGGELECGELVFRMDGKLMCCDCFRAWILDLWDTSPTMLAGQLGIECTTI